jgi:hypothetical protein
MVGCCGICCPKVAEDREADWKTAPRVAITIVWKRMKFDVPNEYLLLVVAALEHYYAYTPAVGREDSPYQEAAW